MLGSRFGLFIDDHNLRYPDVAVYRDPRDTGADPFTTLAGRHPRVLVVVFGPDGPASHDARRIEQYRGIGSLQAILVVHSATSKINLVERADRV